jgi:ferrous iron transport protein A
MPKLIDLKKGDVFKVVDFKSDCENFNRRLQEIGLKKGQMGQVINKSLFGPIHIEVDGVNLAIGRGMAKKIDVKKFECPILE